MTRGEIADQARRLTQQMLEEATEHRRRNSMKLRELEQRTHQRLQQIVEEAESRAERVRGESTAAPSEAGQHTESVPRGEGAGESSRSWDEEPRRQQEPRARPTESGGVPVQSGEEDGSRPTTVPSGEIDRQEAIARSVAARRRNNVVAPIDDDGDDEAEYYRRNSWLV